MIALLLVRRSRRARGRECVHLPQCAAEVAHVVGQPVDQHGERHGDTGEDVHHREEPQHSLLHGLGLLVHRSSCHVALHAEVLHKPQAETHQEHEDTDDRLATSGSTGEVIGHADNAEHIGLGELLGGCYVERAQRIAFTVGNVWNGRQRIEHGHEHRALNEHRQAGASRIDVIVLIQFHGFTAHGLPGSLIRLAFVLVLNTLHLRRQCLHLAHRLHLLVEQREDTSLHHQHQDDNGKHP